MYPTGETKDKYVPNWGRKTKWIAQLGKRLNEIPNWEKEIKKDENAHLGDLKHTV